MVWTKLCRKDWGQAFKKDSRLILKLLYIVWSFYP